MAIITDDGVFTGGRRFAVGFEQDGMWRFMWCDGTKRVDTTLSGFIPDLSSTVLNPVRFWHPHRQDGYPRNDAADAVTTRLGLPPQHWRGPVALTMMNTTRRDPEFADMSMPVAHAVIATLAPPGVSVELTYDPEGGERLWLRNN